MTGTNRPGRRDVMALLDEYNMPHSSVGFPYLVDAILKVCEGGAEDESRKIMSLYDELAEQHHTKPVRIERAIRTMLNRVSCNKTNGQFIYWAADKLLYGYEV